MNNCVFTGRLTKDPVVSEMNNGGDISLRAKFSIAIDYGWGDNKKTMFLNCQASRPAKFIRDYSGKGDKVLVRGELNSFQSQQDETIYILRVDDFEIVQKKGANSENGNYTRNTTTKKQSPPQEEEDYDLEDCM